MRRFALLFSVVALILAIPATHAVLANTETVQVCHLNSANQPAIIHLDYVYDYYLDNYITGLRSETHSAYSYTMTYYVGKVISVDANAVDAHVAHGDSTAFLELNEATAELFETEEDRYSDSDYEYEADFPGYYHVYYRYVYDYDVHNAVVKNGDCWFYTSVYE